MVSSPVDPPKADTIADDIVFRRFVPYQKSTTEYEPHHVAFGSFASVRVCLLSGDCVEKVPST
jgi:hypothetical protein